MGWVIGLWVDKLIGFELMGLMGLGIMGLDNGL